MFVLSPGWAQAGGRDLKQTQSYPGALGLSVMWQQWERVYVARWMYTKNQRIYGEYVFSPEIESN